MSASVDTIRIAQELSARIAIERPDLLHAAAVLLDRLNPCQHAPDYSSVLWYGIPFTFTPRQALAVECLWLAWERGLTVSLGQLIAAARTGKVRAPDLFKDNAAWGVMIHGAPNRCYCLAPPPKQG